MSSKRKSPPSKLQEGCGPGGGGEGSEEAAAGGEGSDLEVEESSCSPLHEAPLEPNMHSPHPGDFAGPPSMFYKLSSASSSSGGSGSELEDLLGPEEDLLRSPPNKKKRFVNQDIHDGHLEGTSPISRNCEDPSRYYQTQNSIPKSLMTPNSLQALLALNQSAYLDQTPERLMTPPGQNHRRRKSGCESPPDMEKMAALLHLNNNSTTLNHNNSGNHINPGKRTMDDVLKRLTSKMNNSTIREEKRPGSPGKQR